MTGWAARFVAARFVWSERGSWYASKERDRWCFYTVLGDLNKVTLFQELRTRQMISSAYVSWRRSLASSPLLTSTVTAVNSSLLIGSLSEGNC